MYPSPGRILGNFRPFFVASDGSEISALFPGKRAENSFSAWAEGGGRRAVFTRGLKNCQSFWCYLYSSVHYSCVYKTVLCNAHLSNTQLCAIFKCAKPRYLQYLYVQYSVACNIRLCSTQLNAILSSVFEFITAGNRGCPRHNLRPPLDDGCIEPSDFSCH